MRFISIFTHEPVNRAPTEAEMAAMGKLIEDAMKEGWLLSTEGVSFGHGSPRAQERGRQDHGHRRPVHRVEGGHRRLRAAEGRVGGGNRQAHAAVSGSPGKEPARSTPLYEMPERTDRAEVPVLGWRRFKAKKGRSRPRAPRGTRSRPRRGEKGRRAFPKNVRMRPRRRSDSGALAPRDRPRGTAPRTRCWPTSTPRGRGR